MLAALAKKDFCVLAGTAMRKLRSIASYMNNAYQSTLSYGILNGYDIPILNNTYYILYLSLL